ncbi:MAG: hypothetical protein WCW35_03510 [Bacteroidota bacterium]|jgi:hypothetical protein
MLHQLLYIFHSVGMVAIIFISFFFIIRKDVKDEVRKKLSVYLLSAAHTQLLTGFALFFLLFADINHMKVGIKMLFAIDVAVFATLYRKKIAKNELPNQLFVYIIFGSAIAATVIAFTL